MLLTMNVQSEYDALKLQEEYTISRGVIVFKDLYYVTQANLVQHRNTLLKNICQMYSFSFQSVYF